jgi:acyl phosphate:glycerol-3-phosphate acyltransferase
MVDATQIVLILVAYLLGSVPTAVWVGKLFYSIDIREHGSGNAGATNTMRILGPKAGIPVLIVDVLKGFLAVQLIHFSPLLSVAETTGLNFKIALCVAALIGHIFPVFVGFRGGKGVATLLGGVIAISSISALTAVAVFVLVLFIFRYVSLASMCAGLSFPFSVLLFLDKPPVFLLIFAVFVAALLIITHKKNIVRLINREESRFDPFSKAKTAK